MPLSTKEKLFAAAAAAAALQVMPQLPGPFGWQRCPAQQESKQMASKRPMTITAPVKKNLSGRAGQESLPV